MVPLSEIADPKNDYNLNIPRYIDSSEPEDLQDLTAHLHGGIPDRDLDLLSGYWDAFPQLRCQLFKPNRLGYSDLTLEVGQVQQTILDSPEFQEFAASAQKPDGRVVLYSPQDPCRHSRQHPAERPHRCLSVTTCLPGSSPFPCSTNTTCTNSS